MYIPSEMKLNGHKDVAIPTNREYFERFGLTNKAVPYSGDAYAPAQQRKTDSLASAAAAERNAVRADAEAAQAANAASGSEGDKE